LGSYGNSLARAGSGNVSGNLLFTRFIRISKNNRAESLAAGAPGAIGRIFVLGIPTLRIAPAWQDIGSRKITIK